MYMLEHGSRVGPLKFFEGLGVLVYAISALKTAKKRLDKGLRALLEML
jgi:hypothetical protein